MLVIASLVGLAAAGQTLVILLGGIDLSVSSFIVVGALAVSQMTDTLHVSFGVALLGLCALSLVLGGFVGYICHRLDLQPLIVTLAMGSIAVGIVQVEAGGSLTGGAPASLSHLTSPASTTFGLEIPPLVAIWAVVAIVLAIGLHRTNAGRRLYATGANRTAADLALISTRRVWTIVFALSALMASLVGVLLAGFAGSVDANLGNPYLFQSIAAVIVGGTALGGPGDYTRSVLGALLLTVVSTVMVGHGFESADQQIFYGVILGVAVSAYGRDRRVRDRV
jgi:ribose transport system permease protein